MRLPELGATTPLRAWLTGATAALGLSWIALRGSFGLSFLAFPFAAAVLAAYALTVRPRAFAASGVLFGILPVFTWGLVDGLMRCVAVRRGGGFCEADPSAQVAITIAAYVGTLAVTALALRSTGR